MRLFGFLFFSLMFSFTSFAEENNLCQKLDLTSEAAQAALIDAFLIKAPPSDWSAERIENMKRQNQNLLTRLGTSKGGGSFTPGNAIEGRYLVVDIIFSNGSLYGVLDCATPGLPSVFGNGRFAIKDSEGVALGNF